MQKKSTDCRFSSVKLFAISFPLIGAIVFAGCASEPKAQTTQSPVPSKTAQSTKSSAPVENTIPSPTGTLAAKGQLDCPGLTPAVNTEKTGFILIESSTPTDGSYEARALKSGGQSCKWENSASSEWVTISLQKVSPEDYRDIAANLQAVSSPANFNSANGSQSFLELQGDSVVAHELNTTYWLTSRSNVLTNQNDFLPIMIAAEKQLVG